MTFLWSRTKIVWLGERRRDYVKHEAAEAIDSAAILFLEEYDVFLNEFVHSFSFVLHLFKVHGKLDSYRFIVVLFKKIVVSVIIICRRDI